MRARQKVTVLLAVTLMWPAATYSQQTAEELFQAGLYQEEVQGDLEQAIQLYRQLVDEYGSNRAVAARALLHLGQCYEKLGREEAANAYERLLRDYADQSDLAAEARARLATLRPEEATTGVVRPATRLISDGYPEIIRTPLRDGRHLLNYDTTSNTYMLVDIQSGSARPLLTTDSTVPFFSSYTAQSDLSPDGRTLAGVLVRYDAAQGAASPIPGSELRVFDVGANGTGRVVHRWDPGHRVWLFGWGPDGHRVWTWVMQPDHSAQIASVDITDGTYDVLKTLAYRDHSQPPSLSADGRFMTYHDAPDLEFPPDVFLIATDGTGEFRIEHPASDSKPVFAPDGSGIVFESDRRGARDLWFLPVADGRPAGEPRVAWRDLGLFGQVLRFADNGSLFYYFATNEYKLYTAEIDVVSHAIENVEALPSRRRMSTAPAWSPDGRRLAYRRGGSRVVIRDLPTGSEREILVGGGFDAHTIEWCGGSASLVVIGYDGELIAYEVSLGSGEIERLHLNRPDAAFCVDRGETIVYQRLPVERGSRVGQIARHSLASGNESILYEGPITRRSLARSMDGTQLAFMVEDSAAARGGNPFEGLPVLSEHQPEYPVRLWSSSAHRRCQCHASSMPISPTAPPRDFPKYQMLLSL